MFADSPLRRKSKDLFARNQDNVSEWSDMSSRGLLFQQASTIIIQTQRVDLLRWDIIIISSNVTCTRHDIAEKLFTWC